MRGQQSCLVKGWRMGCWLPGWWWISCGVFCDVGDGDGELGLAILRLSRCRRLWAQVRLESALKGRSGLVLWLRC